MNHCENKGGIVSLVSKRGTYRTKIADLTTHS